MDPDKNHKILDWFSPDLLTSDPASLQDTASISTTGARECASLTEFIEQLRGAGYNIGISQYIAAQDLLLSLISQDLLLTPDRLSNFLAPILCSSSVEQENFSQHFRKWLELVETRNSLSSAEVKKADGKLEGEDKQIHQKSRKFKTKLALIAIFSVLISIGFIAFFKSQSPEDDDTNTPKDKTLEQVEDEARSEGEETEESTSSPSNDSEISLISLNWQIILVSGLFVSGVAYFGYKKWWWSRQAHLFLQRRETTQTPRLDKIALPGLENSLFEPLSILKTAQRLRHRIRVSANTIDVRQTIYSSLQNGVWFTPSYGYRQVFPEYLFLIDRASIWDHQAKLVEQLTTQLKQSGVYITTYFFDDNPRVCFPSIKGILPLRLPELNSKYQQHRLVVFADTEIFANKQTVGYEPWVEQLFNWQNPVAITPKPLDSWGRNEFLLAQSLTLLPLSDTGIQVWGRVMQEGSATYPSSPEIATPPIPTILKSRPKRWIERNPPIAEQAKAIVVGLRTYLGNDGFYWLAACAVFPQLRWQITLYLGNKLQTPSGDSLLESCSLLNLVRLPWYRYGYMPDWFRGYLIATLTQQQQTEVRLALQELLMKAIVGSEGTLPLEIARQNRQSFLPRLTKPILRILSKQASKNTPLKDYLFLDFMSGKSQLALEIPQEIAPILRQYSQTKVLKPPKISPRKIRILKVIGIITALALVSIYSYSSLQDWVIARKERHEAALASGLDKYDKGNYEEAISDYDRAIQIDPNYAYAYYNRGLAYRRLEDYQSAIADYGRAIQIDPNDSKAYYNRGNAYSDLEEYQQAISDYTQAIEIDPNYAYAYNNRGNRYSDLEEYQKAIADYDRAIQIDPNYAKAYNNRGNRYSDLKKYQQAISDFNRAIAIDPNYAKAYYNRGNNYSDLEELQNAIADYTRAIEIDPSYANAYYNRGFVYRQLEEYQKAISDYEKAARLYQQEGDETNYQNTLKRIEELQQRLNN